MPIMQRPSRVMEIAYQCDACNSALMQHTGKTANGFLHQCIGCGSTQVLNKKYPTVEFIPISTDAIFSPKIQEDADDSDQSNNPIP
jgi:hypothetical protein